MSASRLAAIVLLAAGLAAAADWEIDPEALARGRALLAAQATKSQLSAHLDRDPFVCAEVGADREICTWSLGNRDRAWSALAATLPSDDRVNVVCELSRPGGAVSAAGCTVHPRRSNRYAWKPNRGSAKERMKRKAVSKRQIAERRGRAAALLAAAGSALELSRVVGQGPSQCVAAGAGLRRCTWYTTAQTWGHGTLAMAGDASIHKKIWMACALPESGPRDPQACEIAVGTGP